MSDGELELSIGPMPGPVVVSGATGFLGSAVCQTLAARGATLRRLVRSPPPDDPAAFAGTLPDDIDPNAFAGAAALVHCAWDTRFRSVARAREVNVEGSRRLFAAAHQAGARVLFVSSLSAHGDAESVYGRTKLEVEGLLDLERDAILRPGTIIGEGGVFWRQAQSIARLPFVPLFFGGEQRYQTVALADLCTAIANVLERGLKGRFGVAEISPVSLQEVYRAVAEALGKRARFLRLPGSLALPALRAAEGLGLRLPLSSDNLLGLKRLRPFDLAADVRSLGIAPRTTRESLAEIRWERIAQS
jgi:nucleoside-diphosphate-sugar epimerase